ncbi:hypothetical protein C8F01DRAFT_1248546 [Mycena amicta]|nr:hypothetical protein C8F01DRAFT_1248546 [Mycena amicta]
MSSEVMQLLPGQTPRWQIDLFNSLYTTGLALLTIVILPPIFARNVRRSALWFAFLASWMLYCISFLILVGNQLGPDPAFGLCLFQAAMIHAAPAFATLSGVCFIVDIFFTLRLTVAGDSIWIPKRRTPFLLSIPIVAFLSLFILSLVIGLQDHTTITREPNNQFCHVNTGLPTIVSAILSGWSIFIALGLEVAAAIMLRRSWHRTPFHKTPSSDPQVSLGMLIRIALFSLLTLLGLGLSATILFHIRESDIKYNILLPILPTLAAILFGSQKDIVLGWRFWKNDTKAPQVGPV